MASVWRLPNYIETISKWNKQVAIHPYILFLKGVVDIRETINKVDIRETTNKHAFVSTQLLLNRDCEVVSRWTQM